MIFAGAHLIPSSPNKGAVEHDDLLYYLYLIPSHDEMDLEALQLALAIVFVTDLCVIAHRQFVRASGP